MLLLNGTMVLIVALFYDFLCLDSGIVQQIRERSNADGSSEFEYYIHYIDCIACFHPFN